MTFYRPGSTHVYTIGSRHQRFVARIKERAMKHYLKYGPQSLEISLRDSAWHEIFCIEFVEKLEEINEFFLQISYYSGSLG